MLTCEFQVVITNRSLLGQNRSSALCNGLDTPPSHHKAEQVYLAGFRSFVTLAVMRIIDRSLEIDGSLPVLRR